MSSSVFDGDVMVPGESGRGLSASLAFDAGAVTLTTESDVLGTWASDEYEVQPVEGGEFRLTLGGEDLLFRPELPAEFATAVLPEGTPIPLSEADAHHELWDESETSTASPDMGSNEVAAPIPPAAEQSEAATAEPSAEVTPAEKAEKAKKPKKAKKAKKQASPSTAWPPVQSDLNEGLDDGIITAGFLRAIVVVSAALITFAIVAILLI